MKKIQTPYYLIDKSALKKNMEKMRWLCDSSGVRVLLALKCFASWCVFDFMSQYQTGTTSSSLYEVKLGKELFPGETHAYSVAFDAEEIQEVVAKADKIIFNSVSQLNRFKHIASNIPIGLRVNPGISYSNFLLADPARPHSRLGVNDPAVLRSVLNEISGLMFHFNCENNDFRSFCKMLLQIEANYAFALQKVTWVSLGGGIDFTSPDYPLEAFAHTLQSFANRYQIQVYLEPGEASITGVATLEVTVLDLIPQELTIAVVDASTEAHMLDLLLYDQSAILQDAIEGKYSYQIAGRSCLAGDIFGHYRFEKPLAVGDRLSFQNAAGYTLVKKNWFNGLRMPSIAVKELDGSIRLIKQFSYEDYKDSLS